MKNFISKCTLLIATCAIFIISCTKERNTDTVLQQNNEEEMLKIEAEKAIAEKRSQVEDFEMEFNSRNGSLTESSQQNIVQIAQGLPIFKSLVAAVIKTDLAGVLSSASLNATVFAPTDGAFSKLPPPFNNAVNINAITDATQIATLKNILLYHVLGTKVRRNQIAIGRSSAISLKPSIVINDNKIYFSNNLGLLLINGNSLVVLPNVDASNGIIHVIDDVLLPPSQTIAGIAAGNPAFSTLVAALVKTNLAGTFAGTGNFTVFAPTNDAFASLPAPFNNAANISAIADPAQITSLTNILKYHVTDSRYFTWDLGILSQISTIAPGSNNKIIGILGLNRGWVKGNTNGNFSKITPSNILAVNGIVQVIDRVLLP